jgi:Holliday junction resolvase RusA-like endonuclease
MTASLHITIPGQPIGKGRPRFGNGRTFTPTKTRSWEAAAVGHIRAQVCRGNPIAGPVSVSITAFFERPKRMLTRKWPDKNEWHTAKPDADNVAKIVCDALQLAGVIEDDAAVCRMVVYKFYAARWQSAHIEIIIAGTTEAP